MGMDLRTSIRLALWAIYDYARAILGATPAYIPITAPPKRLALMNAKDALDGYKALKPMGANIPNYVAARIALSIFLYHPGRYAKKINTTVLYCICEDDTVAPTAQTIKYALKTPKKSIKIYPYGHFEIYTSSAFEHVVNDQIDFLKRAVPTMTTG